MSTMNDDDDDLKDFLDETSQFKPPQSLINFSDEDESNENQIPSNFNQDESSFNLQTTTSHVEYVQSTLIGFLQIVAQPDCPAKIRYRKDYRPPSTRRDPLGNKDTNSNYIGPAVQISPTYLHPGYFIGVSLATLMHEISGCCLIHPYELESIDHNDYNDRVNNIVWYPIREEDRMGLKSFPDLRVVRKTEDELQNHGDLRPFHGFNVNLLQDAHRGSLSKRQIVPHYNLKKARLAFFLGQKPNLNESLPTMIDSQGLIFSDEFTLLPTEKNDDNDKSVESTGQSDPLPLPVCRVDRYAPHFGYSIGGDDMLISLTKKPEETKYGKIKIKFQSIPFDRDRLIEINPIEVKYQAISFRIPNLPWPINTPTKVNVIVQQGNTLLDTLEYSYIPQFQCDTCQRQARSAPLPVAQMYSNKRTKSNPHMYDDESDALVPTSPTTPVSEQTNPEPQSDSSNTTPETQTSSNQANVCENVIMQKLNESIEHLFLHNDYQPILRTCRLSVQKRPELLHHAIRHGYSDLVSTFVPIAGMKLMQEKNEQGETVLLHAARLNHCKIVQAVLGRKESEKLLADTNEKRQNILHILASNTDSIEILDFFIDYLLKKAVDIGKEFDHADDDNHTPLQLAIRHNHLPMARYFLKYFNKNVSMKSDRVQDNLIHLSIRYADLTMLKYLIDEGQMVEQGNQTNASMTPIELAQSLNRDDMIDYLKTIYPQAEQEKH